MLVSFKECLANGVMPFILADERICQPPFLKMNRLAPGVLLLDDELR